MLIQPCRHTHFKLRYWHVKKGCIIAAGHEERAVHFSQVGRQVTKRSVLVELAWFQNRLLPNNPFSLYFPNNTAAVVNKPVAAQQLNGVVAAIFNGNLVSKNKLAGPWVGVLR